MKYNYCLDCGAELPSIEENFNESPTIEKLILSSLPTLKLKIEEPEKTIKIRIQEVARRAGIMSAYQLQKLTDLHISSAYRVFAGDWENINIKTLNIICNRLKCTPNDILDLTPEIDE